MNIVATQAHEMKLYITTETFEAILEDVSSETKLEDIRTEIESRLKDLVPQKFSFLYKNVPITAKQEMKLCVCQCADKSESDPEICKIKIRIMNSATNPPVVELDRENHSFEVDKTEKASNANQQNVDKQTLDNHTTGSKQSANLLPFTQEEIENQTTCWLEKARKDHWNSMVRYLPLSKEVEGYTKVELVGVIDTSWTVKKAKLLRLKAAELEVTREKFLMVFSEKTHSDTKKTSRGYAVPTQNFYKNMELVEKTLFLVKNEDTKLIEAQCPTVSHQRQQSGRLLHEYLADLKRAIDAFF